MGKRDFAILLLLVRLGMRACEVANLTLDDLDWSNGEILINGKGVKRKRLPISNEIGRAIVSYVKVRRQGERIRNLFLRSFPPYGGITNQAIGSMANTVISRAGLKPFKSGSHLLRHTAATEMLRKGASLIEIGMILGHRGVESTAVYAKVDFGDLQPIAQAWPKSSIGGGVR